MNNKKAFHGNRYIKYLVDKLKISKHEQKRINQISIKHFTGSKPSSFYDNEYYEKGTKSNYGRLDRKRNKYFYPHQERYYLPERMRKAQENRVQCALFESDGGRWQLDAIQAIAEWLRDSAARDFHIIA